MCPGMWKTSSSYCRFEDVQLEDDDLETQFVARVSADLTNSRTSVCSKSLSPLVVNTVELNCVVLCHLVRSAMSSISTFHSHKLSIVLMRYYVDGGRVGRRECHNDAMKCTRVGL